VPETAKRSVKTKPAAKEPRKRGPKPGTKRNLDPAKAAARAAAAVARKIAAAIARLPTDDGWHCAELAAQTLTIDVAVASQGALLLSEPLMEHGGKFPAGPVISLMLRFLHERRWAPDQLASLVERDPSMIRAILSYKRRTLSLDTVDRLLMAMDMNGEWHRSLAPYWLDDAQQAEIDEIDIDQPVAA
jgi:hypothetical protein